MNDLSVHVVFSLPEKGSGEQGESFPGGGGGVQRYQRSTICSPQIYNVESVRHAWMYMGACVGKDSVVDLE